MPQQSDPSSTTSTVSDFVYFLNFTSVWLPPTNEPNSKSLGEDIGLEDMLQAEYG